MGRFLRAGRGAKRVSMRRIFVCGSLRKGEVNHCRFKGFGDRLLATGTIASVLLRNLGEYPALVPSASASDVVVGEVYEVPDDLADVIDAWEREAGYQVGPVRVATAGGEVEARAYFHADPDAIAERPVVEGGDWSLHRDHPR
jgi:gamma-glutamylcyclotransferase (GGCT)/AIG2-like uncharacterized protein YtfP